MSHSAMPEIELTTRCDCGAITLTASGQIISMLQCACENCQRVSGSGHSSVALIPADMILVTGATKTYSRPADSGATFTRHFCPECGTTMHARSSRAPGISILPVGIFTGQTDWFMPNQLIFASSHRDWDLIEDHLPRHDRYRDSAP